MATIIEGREFSVKRLITQEKINSYASVSQDFNPIHVNEEFAAATPLGGTIAHGMFVLADISRLMIGVFGLDWIKSGRLAVRFKSPARPGDTITTAGKIIKVERLDEGTTVESEIRCLNQKNEIVIDGETLVTIKN